MKKNVLVCLITALLFAIVILEQIFVDNTLTLLMSKSDNLDCEISNAESINTKKINNLASDLDSFWTGKEKIMCLIINHNDLNKVGEQIKKVKVYVLQNDKNNCVYEIETLKFYAETYKHVMEINLQNLM